MPCKRGTLVQAADMLPARCVGRWSGDKLYYVRAYLELFSRAMHKKFPVRHYIDLFAGPGRCRFDDDSGEIDGSPLVALSLSQPFTKYHFVEANPNALDALKRRVSARAAHVDVTFYGADANKAIDSLRDAIPQKALTVVVIDPTGLHLHFESLRRLVSARRMDLIYLFPEGMAAKRNIAKFLKQDRSALDDTLGSRAWRRRVPTAAVLARLDQLEALHRPLVELLRSQLGTLGYQNVSLGEEILIRSVSRNLPLYYLVFASKDRLGHTFWNMIRKTDAAGQTELFQ